MSAPTNVLRFDSFELDPGAGELRKNGDRIKLPPQPCRVLELLVRRSGEVVTRAEIRAIVWRDDTFVDFEQGLNFCIRQIREAVGDSAGTPRFIETLPRRGYRFLVPVEAPAPATSNVWTGSRAARRYMIYNDAPDRFAVPHPSPRPRYGFSGVQPCGCTGNFPVGIEVVRCAIKSCRISLFSRCLGFEDNRARSRR